MSHPMPAPHQTQYSGAMPQQHPNAGQQRHTSGTQQGFGLNMPGETQDSIPDTIQGSHLVSFVLEKPRNATSWEDVVPEQQHVAVHDLKKEVHKFRRNNNSVTKALKQISSPNCRRIVNELVEQQNVELAKLNPALEYRIVSVVNTFRERASLTRRETQLVRVDIILEAEESGLQRTKMGVKTPSNGHDINRIKQANSQPQLQSQINNPGQNMAAQHQMPQQRFQNQVPPNPGPTMHSELPRGPPPPGQGNGPIPMHSQHPPPPPPPSHPGGGMNGQAPMGGPLPPPPPHQPQPQPTGASHPNMPGPQMRQSPMQQHPPQGVPRMPGSYPEAMPRQMPGMRSGLLNELTDAELLRFLKARSKNHTDSSGLSSESDSWEDESGSSSFVDIDSPSHDDTSGRENHRGRRTKSKKSSKHRIRSTSKKPNRSRGRSRSRPRKVVHERHGHGPERRHRNHSRTHHITEDRTRSRGRSGNASPVSASHEKRRHARHRPSQDSLSESSWDRASGTESWYTSSIHTAEDGTWDTPLRPRTRQRQPAEPIHHRRQPNTSPHRYSHRSSTENVRDNYLDDDDHHAYTPRPPLPHRRTTNSVPYAQSPPHPPKPVRAYSFNPPATTHTHAYEAYPPRRHQRVDSALQDEQINVRDLQAALDWAREKKKQETGVGGAKGVRYADERRGRRDSGGWNGEDEWAFDGGRRERGYWG